MKRIHKISAIEIITLTRNLDIVNILNTQKDIQKIKRFKKIIIFKVNNKCNKKTLKLNNFQIKNVFIATILRRECAKIIMHNIKVKSIFKNIKKKKTKIIIKLYKIMH